MSHELPYVLKKAGLKNTPARNLILELFSSDCKPINAEFIYGKLKSKSLNQVTIYRTLATLERVGILKKADLRKGSAYYELTDDNDHHHFVCTNCGRIEDFTGCNLDTVIKTALKKTRGFAKVTDHSLELFGLCTTCAKK